MTTHDFILHMRTYALPASPFCLKGILQRDARHSHAKLVLGSGAAQGRGHGN